jgi:hypothetical protein
MDWYWTWGGECFGYRQDDRLFAYYGLQVGQFHNDEVYGADGRYLGEVKNKNRLITNLGKRGHVRGPFARTRVGNYARHGNYSGNGMLAGHEDFPSPDSFEER